MNDTLELDDFEARLHGSLRVPLPAAPPTLIERLHAAPVTKPERARGRFAVVLVPAAIGVVLVALAMQGVGPQPNPTASPSGPTGLFEPVTVDAFDGASAMDDVWAIGQGFVGMVWGISNGAERADLVRSEDGRDWTLVPPPRDGLVVSAGGVVNGQVHVLGYTGTLEHPTWWHDAVDRDGNWHEIGRVTGIPDATRVIELTHGSSGWLARISVRVAEGLNDTESQIRYSADGLDWTDPAVPDEFEAPSMYTGVGTDGDALLVFRYFDTDAYVPGVQPGVRETAPTQVIRSTDGRTWTVDVVGDAGSGPRFMAFNGQRFVGVGSIPIDDAPDAGHAAAWFSDGGRHWEAASVMRPSGAVSESMRVVTGTLNGGFVAVGSSYGEIWTSADGKTWQWFPALGAGETWNPYAVAVLHNEIVVAGSGPDGKPIVWVRRLQGTTSPA